MQLFNVRLGLATNSSSSHSLIFIEDMEVSDYRGYRERLFLDEEPLQEEPAEFGWEHFTCASQVAKMRYLGVLLKDRLYQHLPQNIANLVLSDWLDPGVASDVEEGYIDHQSWMFLPSSFGTDIPDEKFFEELKDYFLQDNLIVLGGNDNEDYGHPLDNGSSFVLPLDRDSMWKERCICRKDEKYNYWTMFWPENGSKIRFRLENGSTNFKDFPQKASAPELIDIKITDFCPFGCEYCVEPDTPVLLSDLRWIPIKDVKEGEQLIAFDEFPTDNKLRKMRFSFVENKWKTKKRAIKITTDKGSITCSFDHKFLMSHSGGRWQKAGYMRIGQTIAFGSQPWANVQDHEEYAKGYLRAMTEGDGTARWKPLEGATKHPNDSRRQVWWRVALKDRCALERTIWCLNVLEISHLGIKPFQSEYGKMEKVEVRSRNALDMICEMTSYESEGEDFKKGFLAGAMDSEGSVSEVLRISQTKNNSFKKMVKAHLDYFGFDSISEPQGIRLRGGMWEITRLLGICCPTIERRKVKFDGIGMNHSHATIVALEDMGEVDLVDIQTSTKTFYAGGFASHNCYQSSTQAGKHCEDVWSLVGACRDLEVFEVALGGGEPTLHPSFPDILKQFREAGIIPNFTTRNLTWLHDPKTRDEIMQHCGAFAVSVNDEKDIKELSRVIDYANVSHERVNLHVVMGTVNRWEFNRILSTAQVEGFRTTLLGWKNVGFATDVEPEHYGEWLSDVKKLKEERKLGNISIDTVLAAEYDEILEKSGVSKLVYHTKDGGFSCYIDWVSKQMGPSSYEPDKLVSIPTRTLELTDEISRIFASF